VESQSLTIDQTPSLIELRNDIEKELLQDFSNKESDYRNEIHRLTVERNETETLVQQHDKEMDAAKARCEEAKNVIHDVQSKLEVARKEKMEVEARLKTVESTAQSESSNASELEYIKGHLLQKAEELQERTAEFAKLESAHSDLEARKASLQVSWEQQQIEISQHSSVIESLRQETDAERREERCKSNAAIDLAEKQTCRLEKQVGDLQEKLEQARLHESKLNKIQATLVAERDGLRSRTAELETAKEISDSQFLHLREEMADAVGRYEDKLDTLRRQHERSNAALKEAEAKIQLQKTEHHRKIEFDHQKYDSIVQALTDELGKMQAQATNRPHAQQQASELAILKHPTSHSSQNMQAGKARKKVNRKNNSVLNVAGLSNTLVSTSTHGVATGRHEYDRRHDQAPDQSDNLFDEEQDSFGIDKREKDHGCSIVDPAAEPVEDTQDVDGALLPFEGLTDKASQKALKRSQHCDQNLYDESSLSASLDSDDLGRLSEDVRTVQTQLSQERVPETPTRSGKYLLAGSHSSQSYDRPGSQANTASRLMPPPGSVSSHFDQRKSSPAAHSNNSPRKETYYKVDHELGSRNTSSPAFEDQPFSAVKDTRNRRSSVWGAPRSNEGQSEKRKHDFDQDASSKRQRAPLQPTPHRESSASHPYSPHQSKSPRASAAGGRLRAQKSPSFSPVSPTNHDSRPQLTSSDSASRTYGRVSASNSTSRSRGHLSSASRSSGSTHKPRVYGRHQTRSKSE
jgi:myosin heavy subunit